MGMTPTFEGMREMTDGELLEVYNQQAKNTSIGLAFLRDEIQRREQNRQTRTMVTLTWSIAVMTLVVTVATLINVWLVVQAT